MISDTVLRWRTMRILLWYRLDISIVFTERCETVFNWDFNFATFQTAVPNLISLTLVKILVSGYINYPLLALLPTVHVFQFKRKNEKAKKRKKKTTLLLSYLEQEILMHHGSTSIVAIIVLSVYFCGFFCVVWGFSPEQHGVCIPGRGWRLVEGSLSPVGTQARQVSLYGPTRIFQWCCPYATLMLPCCCRADSLQATEQSFCGCTNTVVWD